MSRGTQFQSTLPRNLRRSSTHICAGIQDSQWDYDSDAEDYFSDDEGVGGFTTGQMDHVTRAYFLNWRAPCSDMIPFNKPPLLRTTTPEVEHQHKVPPSRPGLFEKLPVELRHQVFVHLLPPMKWQSNLLEPWVCRENLHDCIGNLTKSSPFMKQEVGLWYVKEGPKFGFYDDPVLGLVNPDHTEWVMATKKDQWEECSRQQNRCLWESRKSCRGLNCPKAILMNVAALPWQSRALIQNVTACFTSDADDDIFEGVDDTPVNNGIADAFAYLPNIKTLNVNLMFKNCASTWKVAIDEIRHSSGGRRAIPIGSHSAIMEIPRSMTVNIINCWTSITANHLFKTELPKTLLKSWNGIRERAMSWPSLRINPRGLDPHGRCQYIDFDLMLWDEQQFGWREESRGLLPLWYFFPQAVSWSLRTHYDWTVYDYIMAKLKENLDSYDGFLVREGLRRIWRLLARSLPKSHSILQRRTYAETVQMAARESGCSMQSVSLSDFRKTIEESFAKITEQDLIAVVRRNLDAAGLDDFLLPGMFMSSPLWGNSW